MLVVSGSTGLFGRASLIQLGLGRFRLSERGAELSYAFSFISRGNLHTFNFQYPLNGAR